MSSLRQLLGPLTLLTFCTSFAFNRAALERMRADEASLHARRIDWLQRLLDDETSLSSAARRASLASASWFSASSSKEVLTTRSESRDVDLIRQALSLSLDPSSLGFPPHLVSHLSTLVSRTHQVGSTPWSRALFGDTNAMGASIAQARRRAKEALFGGEKGQEDDEQLTDVERQKRAQLEEDEERRVSEWEKSVLEAEAAAAAAEQEAASQPRPAPARAPLPIYSSPVPTSSSRAASPPPPFPSSAPGAPQPPPGQTSSQEGPTATGQRRFYV